MIKLRSLLKESEDYDIVNRDQSSVAQLARSRGYVYRSYRGDSLAGEIFNYSPKERREHGIFTTPIKDVAKTYAGGQFKSDPRLFYIKASKLLNLTDDTLPNMHWVEKWAESFDEWIDKTSGDPMSAWDILQSGQLFDYEGTWSAERWMDLQATAENDGYDAVILPDYDSSHGVFPSLVVFDEKNLKLADLETFDDNKRSIPLELRFNEKTDDIRY
jgi:hypothetical protein